MELIALNQREKHIRYAQNFHSRDRRYFNHKIHCLKWSPVPENCKNQEINRTKSKKMNRTVKLCTLATNSLILNSPVIDPNSILCREFKIVKTNL